MCCRCGGVVVRRYVTVIQSGTAEHEVWAPDVFGRYFLFYFRRCWPLPFCIRYNPVWGRIVVRVEALLYIQQPLSGSKASLSRQVTVTDVERPSLLQSASRGVLRIGPDNPVNFLQAVWMPRPRPMLAGTHWSLLRSFLFQFAYSTHNTRYLWLQVYISSGGERAMYPRSLSCGETVFNAYFWDLTYHCSQVPLSV